MTMLIVVSHVAFSFEACARPKMAAAIRTAMTAPHRALPTASVRFLMGVSAVRRLLPEGHGRDGDDADQDRGHKGLARSRSKAAGNLYPAHAQLDGENREQEQRAQPQSEGEVGPPSPVEMETVVADPAMIEYSTRQEQCSRDQKREHERPNQALIEVWDAPGQTGLDAAVHRGRDEQHHHKDEHAPPGSEAAFRCIPEQSCDCAHGALLLYSCPQNGRLSSGISGRNGPYGIPVKV